jgi:hypothetical protein
MKKRVKYSDEPMEFTVIPDFLPPPEELVRRKRKVRVTLEVREPTVALFRKKGRQIRRHRLSRADGRITGCLRHPAGRGTPINARLPSRSHRKIAGFRHALIHGYDFIDDETILEYYRE